MNTKSSLIVGVSLVVASVILAFGMSNIRKQQNFVTVKGLSEKEVRADQAWWAIHAQYGANNVQEIQSRVGRIQEEISQFLLSRGFTEDEISIEGINIYQNNYQGAVSRLNADIRISVLTNDIPKVKKASNEVTTLLDKGILIQSDKWQSGPKYYFTKFKDLKKDMLAEATQAAKEAAEEFATNSGARVGKIRRANQGIFQILPGNKTQDNEEFHADKIVRVVSSFEYYLE